MRDRVARVIGQKINNYECKRLLGEGGMGAVYVAEHPVLGRRVAIKVLRRELVQDDKLVGRFINEARAADAIRHPNIVQVNDVGLLADGQPYIVMELLEGQTLGARIAAAGRLGVGETLSLAAQAASAVAAAHAVGIVHRDLKPDNIFLVPDEGAPGGQRVKVLDFGIAKLRIELGGSDLRTKTGAVMGTPAYMSPEQCLGRSAEVDHRTDIYALGVILFEMLCGVPPFVGEGFGEVLVMHMTQPPPAPRGVNPDISPAVEQVILRALAKRKEDRFATMDELAQAIAASARDPNITFAANAAGADAGPPRAPTPVRPTTTLSAAAGETASAQMSQLSQDEMRPATSRRWGLWIVGAGALAAAGAFFALTGRREESAARPAAAPAVAAEQVVAPVAVPAPETPKPPPPQKATPGGDETPKSPREVVAKPAAAVVPAAKASKPAKRDKPAAVVPAARSKPAPLSPPPSQPEVLSPVESRPAPPPAPAPPPPRPRLEKL